MIRILLSLLAGSAALLAQPASLDSAYAALQAKSYEAAIDFFHRAIAAEPNRASIHKDLAYTYLKVGEPEAARTQFGEAMRMDPEDTHVALEYAFLCNETKQQAEARRIFDRIRKTGDATAEQAFQNIDRPLAEGIARWSKALELSPDNFSAHQDLAQLAEQRDDLALAALHYEKAFQLRSDLRSLLLDLARVWNAQNRAEDANAALLAASRGGEPRVTEAARALLPPRYPYVYEFQRALVIDSKNVELRRELGYLHLAMGNKAEAILEFQKVTSIAPDDALSAAQLGFLLLSRSEKKSAMPPPEKATAPNEDVSALASRSLQAGYLKDALKYLKIAHDNNPADSSIMLKLGWAYNILHDDKTAMEWFQVARDSPDPKISAEASRAYSALRPSQARFRTTAWTYPFFSSRWKDVFSYSQIKTDIRLDGLPIRPYISTRILGDIRGDTGSHAGLASPQYLSESSFIFAVGLATAQWKGAMVWGEAGEAIRYRNQPNVGRMIPDYRGGVSFSRSIGHNLGAESKGVFFETNNDGVFVSRFQNDILFYSQNHFGYTFPPLASLQFQLFWNGNGTRDINRQYWANYFEQGPGLKFRAKQMAPSLAFTVSAVKGIYTVMAGNPRGPNFYDVRAGLWYAFTH